MNKIRYHIVILVFFAAQSLAFCAAEAIPFQLINGLIVIHAELDQKKGNFILDTGADELLIDNAGEGQQAEFQTLHGNINASMQKVQSLDLGGIVLNDLDAFAVDLSSVDSYTNIDIVGILGVRLFTKKQVIIDFEKKEITFTTEKFEDKYKGLITYNFTAVEGMPMIEAKIGNRNAKFLLDSGATKHLINKEIAESLNDQFSSLHTEINVVTASKETIHATKYIAEKFDLSGKAFFDQIFLAVDFKYLNEGRAAPIDGIFSLSALTTGKVILDLKKNKISF